MSHSKFITVGVGGAIPTKGNSASCNLIPSRGNNWTLIDAGFGCAKNISSLAIPFASISEIIITHFHNDHFCDLPTVLFSIFMSSDRSKCDIYVPPEDVNFLRATLDISFTHLFETIKMATGKTAEVNFIGLDQVCHIADSDIQSFKVQHGDTPTYGITASYEEKTIGFSSDTVICDGLNEIADRSDHLVLDCAFSKEFPHNPLHATADQIAHFVKKHNFETVLLNHMMPETIGKEAQILELIQENCNGVVKLAKDMEVQSLVNSD